MESSPATPQLDFQVLSAPIATFTSRWTTKATERMRRAVKDNGDALATELANQACREFRGVGMGKVGKFEFGKGMPVFEVRMDLQRYLEDIISGLQHTYSPLYKRKPGCGHALGCLHVSWLNAPIFPSHRGALPPCTPRQLACWLAGLQSNSHANCAFDVLEQ